MSRSELEEALYGQMRMLSMAEGSTFPLPVREVHPFWCCECPKARHRPARHTVPRHWYHAPSLARCEGCGSFHEYGHERDWRCDFAWPQQRIIVEVEGGVWTQGRHTRGEGFTKDLAKYNALTGAGWTLYRVSQREISSGEALRLIERALKEAVSG